MMKITAGLGSIDEYERFVQAGADEFFCGYVPFSWVEKYGTVMPLNRRKFSAIMFRSAHTASLRSFPIW